MNIRLQKRIAESGLCSRRKAEELIVAGKVRVNGMEITKLGSKVELEDKIEVNGRTLAFESPVTVMLHKPAGYISSKGDPHNEITIMALLPKDLQHLNPAGRLDKDTEGLLLLSSDGELVQKLTHPSFGHKKTYEVTVSGNATDEELEILRSGTLELDSYQLNPMEFKILENNDKSSVVELTLSEGRKRQIRRVMDDLGFPVLYLKRIKVGSLTLENLEIGEYRELNDKDLKRALNDE